MTGTFLRMTNGSAADWQTHHMLKGAKACPKGLSECDWNALSVHRTVADVEQVKRRAKKFANHAVYSFTMTAAMGRLLQDKPPGSHHNWWPSSTFVPPP